MKVILLEDIDNLGRLGDTVTVKAGYARNFLIPRKLALQATTQNLKTQQNQIHALERRKNKVIEEAKSLSERLAGVMLSYTRKCGSKGQLFGSVTNMDIAASLAEQGLEVNRKDILLSDPIKSLGEFDVTIKLHHEVAPVVKVTVLPEGGVIPEPTAEEVAEAAAAAEVAASEKAASEEAASEEAASEEAVSEEAAEESADAETEADTDPEAEKDAE